MASRRTHTQASTSVAVDWDIFEGDDFDIDTITIAFDSAPTTVEDLTVTLDAAAGSGF